MLQKPLEDFTKYLESKKRSYSTIIAYKKDLEQLNDFLKRIGLKSLPEIKLDHLNAFLEDQRKLGFKEKTISRKINSMKTFFKFLSDNGYLNPNPSDNLTHPKIKIVPPNYLSKMEYMALRDISRRNIRNYTIIELMLQAGLRISEVSGLKIKNLKLNADKPTLFIEEYQSNEARTVPINDTLLDALKAYINEVKPEGEYLFTTKTGKPLLVRNIRTSITKLLEKAGIRNATVNDLRNTHIVHYLKEGMSVEKVAKNVGHKRTSTTERYLALIDKKDIKKGNKRYEDL